MRKDSRGRRLKTGEGQRQDGRYYFRYEDISGQRRTIYDKDLHELRKKEQEINVQLSQGISHYDGNTPLCDMIVKYFELKQKWRETTRATMDGYHKILKSSRLYTMAINKIKMIDIKSYLVDLRTDYSYSVTSKIYLLLKEVFTLAVEDNMILKNPCSFKLKTIIDDDATQKPSLTPEQEQSLLSDLKTDFHDKRYLEIFVVLLGTGLRISEFSALTVKDIDFVHNVIKVDKQIVAVNGTIKVAPPKTKASIRDIPMTDDVRSAIKTLLERRKANKLDVMIDNHIGFICVGSKGLPKRENQYSELFKRITSRHNACNDLQIPSCTPHTLRHTFATKLVASGADIKTATRLMGHSNAQVLLDVYADVVDSKLVDASNMIKIG